MIYIYQIKISSLIKLAKSNIKKYQFEVKLINFLIIFLITIDFLLMIWYNTGYGVCGKYYSYIT